VDDESRNLDVLESILQSSEYQLVRAQTADEALMALLQRDFAAIVLDIRMPGMSGLELAQMIKQRKRSQHIPILFLTAYFQGDEDALQGYGAGAVDYLTKPIDPRILRSKVGVFVELFRTTRALAAANAQLEHEMAQRLVAETARARLAAIVESSSDAISSRTLDGVITSWNEGAERLFGYTADEVLGHPVFLLVPPERRAELEAAHKRIEHGERVEPFETVRLHKDGRPIEVSLTLSPIQDDTGRVTGISGIIRDIGERKRLEAEILQASEREQRRIAEDLHDGLGQQLAGLSCLSDTLKRNLAQAASPEAPSAAKISKLLAAAVAQTRRLARGLYPVTPEPNGLMSALEDLAGNVSDLFNVSCQFHCPKPVLFTDNAVATHLFRIAQEAVTNAVKHGQAKQIKIALSSSPQGVILAVRDDGLGFDKTTARAGGLGLRIMNYRARVIGGTFAIQKKPAGGTEVVCAAPKAGGPPRDT
jgi:PAS domain S-box-containing protein